MKRCSPVFAWPFWYLLLGFVSIWFLLVPQATSQDAASGGTSLTTQERIKLPGTWPTKGAAAEQAFVGDAECAKCHSEIARTQMTTPMANAASLGEKSEILRKNPILQFHVGVHDYRITRERSDVKLSVRDGDSSAAATLAWAFGMGKKGQTYLYSQSGSWYESRVSFYNTF